MIRIKLAPNPSDHVSFAYSPLLESVLSLHVLVEPKHHALHHDWVRRMRALKPELKRRIEAFSFLYRRTLPDLLVPGSLGQGVSFEEEVGKMLGHSPDFLLEEFGRPLFDHGGRRGGGLYAGADVRETMLARAASDGVACRTKAVRLLEDAAGFANELADFLRAYWDAAFASEWNRVEPILAGSVAEAGRQLDAVGIWPVLGRLPPHYRADRGRNELRIELPHEHAVVVSAENPLVLSPSVFVWPHLRVNCDQPWPTALVYTAAAFARNAEPRTPPADLLLALRALADDTRLRVLELIAERPRTTQELAPLVGLSIGGLSKSLGRRAGAGRNAAPPEGYYVG